LFAHGTAFSNVALCLHRSACPAYIALVHSNPASVQLSTTNIFLSHFFNTHNLHSCKEVVVEAVQPEAVVEAETEVVAVATAAGHLSEEAIVEGLAPGLPIVAAVIVAAAIVAALLIVVDPPRAVGAVDSGVGTEAMPHSFSKKANLRLSIPTPVHRRSLSRASAAHGPGLTGPHAQGTEPRESR
jgi:hypothetical protein